MYYWPGRLGRTTRRHKTLMLALIPHLFHLWTHRLTQLIFAVVLFCSMRLAKSQSTEKFKVWVHQVNSRMMAWTCQCHNVAVFWKHRCLYSAGMAAIRGPPAAVRKLRSVVTALIRAAADQYQQLFESCLSNSLVHIC